MEMDQSEAVYNVLGYDQHQFAIFSKEYHGDAERCHRDQCYSCNGRNEERCIVAWQRLISDWQPQDIHNDKLQKLMRKGIPHHLRGTIWKRLLEIDTLKENTQFNYQAQQKAVREQLVELGVSEYSSKSNQGVVHDQEMLGGYKHNDSYLHLDTIRHIMLDLDRSYPTHRQFMEGLSEGLEGRASMFRILAGYARYNSEVGYCQGMSYVAGMLLMHMGEVDAFWCFVAMMERPRFLRGYYNAHLAKVQRHANVFKKLLRKKLPKLSRHLERCGVTPEMYIIPWFMSLFTNIHCWDSVLAIWDLFLLDGVLALFRTSLALLSVLETKLLHGKDISNLLPCLLHPTNERVHYDILIPMLWALTLEDWEVRHMEAIIQEEITEPMMDETPQRKTRASKRHLHDEVNNNVISSKRMKMISPEVQQIQKDSGSTSIFQRFKSVFFKPRSHLTLQEPGSSRKKVTRNVSRHSKCQNGTPVRPQIRPQALDFQDSPMPVQVSPADDVLSLLAASPHSEPATPLRSSPRLALSHVLRERNLNTPTHQVVPRRAAVHYTFKSFTTPHPLRWSQGENSLDMCESPMELKEMSTSFRNFPEVVQDAALMGFALGFHDLA